MSKWRLNGVPLQRNPDTFMQRPTKNVSYRRAVSGNEIRLIPKENAIEMYLDAGWQLADESLRNFLHDLYVQDKKFTLQTHLTSNPRDIWTVKIDEFSAEYVHRGSQGQRFNINTVLKVLDGANDPILVDTYSQFPHPFVVENVTNRDIYDFMIFIRGKSKAVVNPTITQLYGNLISNPGFEQIGFEQIGPLSSVLQWEDSLGAWESDIIFFLEGDRCIKTHLLNAPLSQEIYFPPNEYLTAYWSLYGDSTGDNNARLRIEYLDYAGNVLDTVDDVRSSSTDWQTFWFSTSEKSPLDTYKARVSFEKIAGTEGPDDCIYIDTIMVRIGQFDNRPEYVAHLPTTLGYLGTIEDGSTLKVDTRSRAVTLNATESVGGQISGGFFYLPVGKSLIVFDEESTVGTTEAVIRYDAIWK
jgi:hypothetical protein